MRRRPSWSHQVTSPIGRLIPPRARPAALATIKVAHTLIFTSVAAAIFLFVGEGLRPHPRRRARTALAVALGETAVYLSNNQVCPLTPLAEELGADRGSVSDTFLPDWLSRRIPVVAGSALLLGLVLNLRAAIRER